METFTKPREFVENSGYDQARRNSIGALDLASIDHPIRDIVSGFAGLPYCFSLQCCYGHFICGSDQERDGLEPIPIGYCGLVRYRIAYMAFCLENSDRGKAFRESLAQIGTADSDNIQFGSADWFWTRWANSYVLQVEPSAHMFRDEAILDSGEARQVQGTRDSFFEELRVLLARESS